MQSVLAQSSHVPFEQFRNVPFWSTGWGRCQGDDRVDEASATPPEGRGGSHGKAADAGGGRAANGTHDAAGEAPGGRLPCEGGGGLGLPPRRATAEPTAP